MRENYFHDVKIYFHDVKINFHGLKIDFQTMKIVFMTQSSGFYICAIKVMVCRRGTSAKIADERCDKEVEPMGDDTGGDTSDKGAGEGTRDEVAIAE